MPRQSSSVKCASLYEYSAGPCLKKSDISPICRAYGVCEISSMYQLSQKSVYAFGGVWTKKYVHDIQN